MTQLRRVRALHLVPCCTLHTYSIGCAASQRNNIATIHHTSTVNKISGSFYHPLFSRRSYTFSRFSLQFFFAIYSLHLFPSYLHTRASLRASIPRSFSFSVFATSAYLIFFFFSVCSFARPLSSRRPFLRVSFSLLSLAVSFPPTHIFFLSAFLPRTPSIRFPFCPLYLSCSCPVSTPRRKKHPHHEPDRLTFCSFVDHRRY